VRQRPQRCSSLPADIAELTVQGLLRMPVGPHGVEMGRRKLVALDGRRVRIVGYMATTGGARTPVYLMLAPVPINVAGASPAWSTFCLPATIFVHLPPAQAHKVASTSPDDGTHRAHSASATWEEGDGTYRRCGRRWISRPANGWRPCPGKHSASFADEWRRLGTLSRVSTAIFLFFGRCAANALFICVGPR